MTLDQAVFNRKIQPDRRPFRIAVTDEKFFNSRHSCATSIHFSITFARICSSCSLSIVAVTRATTALKYSIVLPIVDNECVDLFANNRREQPLVEAVKHSYGKTRFNKS